MPLTPDLPFPKSPADAIRSKDWNDHVKETQRLDVAKVSKSGDVMTGPLTIAGALGIGTPAPKAPLHVVGPALISDGDGHAVPNNRMAKGSLTIGSVTASFGGGNNWTANTAGLLMETAASTEIAVHHFGARVASVAHYNNNTLTIGRDMGWGTIGNVVMNGNVGVGVSDPGFKLDAGGRIRLREGPTGHTAGFWLYQSTPKDDRAFVGMASDDEVGLYGNKGAQWGLKMNVTTGNVWMKGRVSSSNICTSVAKVNKIDVTAKNWTAMPDMSLTFKADVANNFLISVQINGVQAIIVGQGLQQKLIAVYFRLLVDTLQQDLTRHEFHQNGWELRGVNLTRVVSLSAGQHTVAVEWYTTDGTASACWYGDTRQIQVIEL